MDNTTRDLLTEVAKLKLQKAKDLEGTDKGTAAFKEAMIAMQKMNDLDKTDLAYQEHYDKLESEEKDREFKATLDDKEREFKISMDDKDREFKLAMEDKDQEFKRSMDEDAREHDDHKSADERKFKKTEARKDRMINIGMFAAGLIVAPIIECGVKKSFAVFMSKLEEFDYWKTEGGRAVEKAMFQWKLKK